LPSAGARAAGAARPTDTHPKTLPLGESGLTDVQTKRFRRDFAGLDIPWLEREFREWVSEREPPADYAAAFYGFMKRKKADMA
jgi:hypothetical protein